MMIRLMRITTDKTNLRRSSKLELPGQNIVSQIHNVLTHRFMTIRAFFAGCLLHGISCAIPDAPNTNAPTPAICAWLPFFGKGICPVKSLC